MRKVPMPELCSQQQAEEISSLSAWVLHEEREFDALNRVLTEAGCDKREILSVMNSEVC